jgi:hypothetical protein
MPSIGGNTLKAAESTVIAPNRKTPRTLVMTPYDEMMSHLHILATKDSYVAEAIILIREMAEQIRNHQQNH